MSSKAELAHRVLSLLRQVMVCYPGCPLTEPPYPPHERLVTALEQIARDIENPKVHCYPLSPAAGLDPKTFC